MFLSGHLWGLIWQWNNEITDTSFCADIRVGIDMRFE